MYGNSSTIQVHVSKAQYCCYHNLIRKTQKSCILRIKFDTVVNTVVRQITDTTQAQTTIRYWREVLAVTVE